jgi:hypothetical protein
MISGDYSASADATEAKKQPQVYIVDFGAATELEGRALNDVFREVEGDEGKDAVVRIYPDDFGVPRHLKKFASAPGDKLSPEERQYLEDLEARRKALERNSRLSKPFAAAIENAKGGSLDIASVFREFTGRQTMPSDDAIDRFITVAHGIAHEAPDSKAAIKQFISDQIKGNLPLSAKNKLAKFSGSLR